MKRACVILLAALLILCCAACGGENSGDTVSGDIHDLLSQVIDGVTDPEMSLIDTEVNDDNFAWYFFIDPIEGAEAAVSEPMIGSIPHFVGLLRVPDGTDAETVRAEIENNLNPQKWVCVEAEKATVVRRGDLILVAMSEASGVDRAVENFNALK